MENKNLIVSQRRLFLAKPMWNISAPTVIGEIETVVETILNTDIFARGVDYIKELDGIQFKRVSKADIARLLSYDAYNEELCTKLFSIY